MRQLQGVFIWNFCNTVFLKWKKEQYVSIQNSTYVYFSNLYAFLSRIFYILMDYWRPKDITFFFLGMSGIFVLEIGMQRLMHKNLQ